MKKLTLVLAALFAVSVMPVAFAEGEAAAPAAAPPAEQSAEMDMKKETKKPKKHMKKKKMDETAAPAATEEHKDSH